MVHRSWKCNFLIRTAFDVQSESSCKAAEEGRMEQQKLKEKAAHAYSTMDESLQEVMIHHEL